VRAGGRTAMRKCLLCNITEEKQFKETKRFFVRPWSGYCNRCYLIFSYHVKELKRIFSRSEKMGIFFMKKIKQWRFGKQGWPDPGIRAQEFEPEKKPYGLPLKIFYGKNKLPAWTCVPEIFEQPLDDNFYAEIRLDACHKKHKGILTIFTGYHWRKKNCPLCEWIRREEQWAKKRSRNATRPFP